MYKVIGGGAAALAAAAIAVIVLSQGTESIDATAGLAPDELLGWDEIVADARHSWFWTQMGDPNGPSMIDASLWMYQITSDKYYLDYIRNSFGDAPLEGVDRRQAVLVLAKLAIVDSSYVKQVARTADEMVELEIDPITGLFYAPDGRKEMYVPYDGTQGIEALLMAYEATSEEKYLVQAKKTIGAVWDSRNRDTNLVPSWLYSDSGRAKEEYMQHYGSAAFLKTLLHHYYLSGDGKIYEIIRQYSAAVEKYAWDGQRWNYRTDADGKPSGSLGELTEANFAKLDDALVLVHDLNSNAFAGAYLKAKGDYDSTFQTGLILSNGLVKHSVYDTGEDHTAHQSVIWHAFSAIQNPAMRFYSDTGNKTYVESLNSFYRSTIEHHRRDNGYAGAVDPYTFQDDEYFAFVDYRAAGYVANKVFALVAPSQGVDIVWTRVGIAQLHEPLTVHYGDAGRFNAVRFDLAGREISMDAVSGEGTIAFPGDIAGATIDGKEYDNAFKGNLLKTRKGTHSYSVRLMIS